MNVTVVGNLCNEPELRHTSNGVPVADLRIAENRNYQDAAGDWQQETAYYSAVVWRRLAEHAAVSLRRGDRVVAVGRMRQDEWTTDRGAHRRRYVVECDELAASVRFTAIEVHRTDPEDQREE